MQAHDIRSKWSLLSAPIKKGATKTPSKSMVNRIANYCSSLSSKIRFGRICSKTPNVIQNGTINPRRNNNIQNAIPAITRKSTIPNTLMVVIFEVKNKKKKKPTNLYCDNLMPSANRVVAIIVIHYKFAKQSNF